ncbi:MFS transporter [Photobacterium sp. OFAV2-7]|uniref:MFS transporter n=1 Tax=Photobacterium sp. OFAV2-7 TaxID=2917748 RepID=UPI001EF552E6|nr:MFS transporter [Photobacterium sp. OFAV2-7]MCG7584345.1 MFS transporter [Photobacterium sp. OFAV2-7]
MSEQVQPLKKREVFGYSIGDFGNNLVYQITSIYLLIFYTDVFGIAPAAAGTLFLVARLWDAINDPVMGYFIDKTNTRWGRFRPYVGFMAIPLGIAFVSLFTVPDTSWDETTKLIYAYVTYIAFGMIYTSSNVPYISLATVMSPSSEVRTKLLNVRSIFAMLPVFVAAAVPAIVAAAGEGNDAKGYQIAAIIIAVMAVASWITTFRTCTEHVDLTTVTKKQNASVGNILKYLVSNKPLLIFCAAIISLFGLSAIVTASGLYMVKYYLLDESLFAPLMICQIIATIMGIILARPLIPRMDKKWILILGFCIAAPRSYIWFTLDPTLILAVSFLCNIGMGIALGVLWSFAPDVIEYGEWKTGLRIDGTCNAIIGFALKVGLALGGIVPGYILDWYEYVPNSLEQSETALFGFELLGIHAPFALMVLGITIMLFYPLTKDKTDKVSADLKTRRQLAKDEAMKELEIGKPLEA